MLSIEKIEKDLIDIKFISGNFNEMTMEELYKSILGKLLTGNNLETKDFYDKFNQLDFLNIGLNLLGYEDKDIISKSKEIGLYISEEEEYNKIEFLKSLYSLLESKTKKGEDFFDILCLKGAFSNYNSGREIPRVLYFNGKTRPIFDYNKSIFEKVYVETPLDTDEDGKRDLIKVYIRRPYETEIGMKVPSIYIANPYMMGGDDDGYILHNVEREMPSFKETNISYDEIKFQEKDMKIPNPRKEEGKARAMGIEKEIELEAVTPWYNYFLSRGYAIVLAGGIGTKGSEGIRTCGSIEETISTISVIDWLNGRLAGFTDKTNNIATSAFWSTGNVGMTGKSYLGTLANAAATTGIEGLRTIVPEAAISNWYDYYRSNGLLSAAYEWQGDDADLLAKYCFSRALDEKEDKKVLEFFQRKYKELIDEEDRITGNYNTFWDERNYLNNVDKIKASVFIVHGLRDFNVKSKQFHKLWEEMDKYPIEKRMLLHQGEHIYLNDHLNFNFTEIMNKWFDYYLYEYENNILDELANVTIQNNTNTDRFDESETWPFNGIVETKYYMDNGSLSRSKGNSLVRKFNNHLTLAGYEKPGDEKQWRNNLILSPDIEKPYRLKYLGEELDRDRRISGVAKLKFKAKLDNKVGILSGMLVDYGLAKRPSIELEEIENEELKLGINAGAMPYKRFKSGETSEYNIITRDSINVQNRRNIYNKDEVIPGNEYEFEIDLEPTDYTILKGHRIGLIIYSTDVEMTERPIQITNFEIDESTIELILPIK